MAASRTRILFRPLLRRVFPLLLKNAFLQKISSEYLTKLASYRKSISSTVARRVIADCPSGVIAAVDDSGNKTAVLILANILTCCWSHATLVKFV